MNSIDFGDPRSKVKVTMDIINKCGVRGDATLCVVIYFLPTNWMLACWYTSLQLKTNNQNDWSLTNQIEYADFRQDSNLQSLCKLFKSLRSSFNALVVGDENKVLDCVAESCVMINFCTMHKNHCGGQNRLCTVFANSLSNSTQMLLKKKEDIPFNSEYKVKCQGNFFGNSGCDTGTAFAKSRPNFTLSCDGKRKSVDFGSQGRRSR